MRTQIVSILIASVLSAACAAAPDSDTSDDELRDACTNSPKPVSWMNIHTSTFDGLKVRIGTMGEGSKGDVLYLHGFADRIDNHRPLFESLTKQGLRVIAFDYPSHGETCGPSLDRYSFTELAKLAGQVERENAKRGPLYLAGWSTGGLLAVRIAQGLDADFSRPIAKMALFAPGVDVRFVTSVSESTLTRNPNPPHVAGPSPTSPLKRPVFASALKLNSELAKVHTLPAGLPVLTFVGGEDADVYADTKGVSKWARTQASRGAESRLVECAGGMHELDNEKEPMGGDVREATAAFLAGGDVSRAMPGRACKEAE
jgi:alpha-beta hydrolase superfamily lysophospholipase